MAHFTFTFKQKALGDGLSRHLQGAGQVVSAPLQAAQIDCFASKLPDGVSLRHSSWVAWITRKPINRLHATGV